MDEVEEIHYPVHETYVSPESRDRFRWFWECPVFEDQVVYYDEDEYGPLVGSPVSVCQRADLHWLEKPYGTIPKDQEVFGVISRVIQPNDEDAYGHLLIETKTGTYSCYPNWCEWIACLDFADPLNEQLEVEPED